MLLAPMKWCKENPTQLCFPLYQLLELSFWPTTCTSLGRATFSERGLVHQLFFLFVWSCCLIIVVFCRKVNYFSRNDTKVDALKLTKPVSPYRTIAPQLSSLVIRKDFIRINSQNRLEQLGKQNHKNELLSSFYLKGNSIGFHSQTPKLEPPCTT